MGHPFSYERVECVGFALEQVRSILQRRKNDPGCEENAKDACQNQKLEGAFCELSGFLEAEMKDHSRKANAQECEERINAKLEMRKEV